VTAVGIDLGTTNTVVGAVRGGHAVTLPDAEGRKLIPSVVSFHPSGKVLVGWSAKDRRIIDPRSTIYSVKRLLGRRWSSPEVQELRARLPFALGEGDRETVHVSARGQVYALPEISAFVLRRAKAVAEAALGEEVRSAVVTVPANFNDLQRASTKVAAQLAGLEVLRVMNEPTAAALAYGQTVSGAQRIAVYDFGGGTFDLTLLDLSRSVYEVLATKGDTALGGDDIDLALVDRLEHPVMKTLRLSVDAPEQRGRLRVLAENLKHELSTATEATVTIDGLGFGPGGVELSTTFGMTRAELEVVVAPFVDRTIDVCRQAMDAAGLPLESFDAVILVGGSTRIPLVQQRVAELFRKEPLVRISPDEVVALGAAIQASMLGRAKSPATQPSAMIRKASTAVLAAASAPSSEPATIPGWKSTLPISPPVSISPAPAQPPPLPPSAQPPAAPQTASAQPPPLPPSALPAPSPPLTFSSLEAAASPAPAPPPPRAPGPLLIDVTPLTLGVETAGGYVDALIPANTPVPCDRTRVFVTAAENQTQVVVRVCQGESSAFAQNTYLGELLLSGLRAAPRGEVQIGVQFEIDENGLLFVRARDMHTGLAAEAHMRPFGAALDPADVERMMQRHRGMSLG
jgi:molecular chaperone DnaK